MKALIKHVAFMSHNAPRLCRFYECLFGLTRARADTSPASEEEFAKRFGNPLLSTKRVAKPYDATVIAGDGNVGVAFLRRRPGYPAGIDHFGIEVDDMDLVFSRYKETLSCRRVCQKTVQPALCILSALMIRRAICLT